MSRTKFKVESIWSSIIILIFIGVLSTIAIIKNFNVTEYTITVTDKEIKRYRSSEREDKYLVFTENNDGEVMVFENTDTLLRFKFDSSDVQAKLKVGNTYKIKAVGYRIKIISNYPNIIEVEEIE